MASHAIGCDQRIAWLLTTSRLLGPDAALARREGFLKALRDRGVKVDNSRVSRWESGQQPLPLHVIASYETALGAAEGSLVAVVAGLRRAFGSGKSLREVAATENTITADDVDDLIDRAVGGLAHGGEWLRLVSELSGYDRVFLRSAEWQRLCNRLVRELATASGAGFVRRYEAAALLIRHPEGQRHLTRALGSFVVHPDSQVMAPVLNLLAEVPNPAANDLVLRMLHSDNPGLRRAAQSVSATKLARGHLPDEVCEELERHVVGNLRRGDSLDTRLDSFDLAVQLPDWSWERLSGALRTRRAYQLVTRARQDGELLPWSQTAAVVQEISTKVQRGTPTHGPADPDAMLTRLMREALFHAHKARRHQAALLLAASPYAPAVAQECLELGGHENDVIAARAWTVLMRVGHPHGRRHLLQAALEEQRSSVRSRSLLNIGLARGALPAPEAEEILGGITESSRPVEQHAAMFALGMSGAPQLTELAGHDGHWAAAGARWWVEHGPAVHDGDVDPDQLVGVR
ncbi:hypothetical protein [Nocardioides panaciterrulae]|uniref:Uncharacterized protein n=1 Tax=Nocardioides panaciterrulae TaxID=661492 RepID=A0A7Y9E7V8_9ACTN|nr:hypothetical protein [Nocardioides panaciterrulae]NYD42838.1 hypothetical protein [Nocardioides panaciterrulae]